MHHTIIFAISAYLAIMCSAAPVPSGHISRRDEAEQEKRAELYCIGNNSARVSDEDGELMQCSFKREELKWDNARAIVESGLDKRIELYSVGNNHAEIENIDDEATEVNKRVFVYSVGSREVEVDGENGVGEVGKRTELCCGAVNSARVSDGDIINPEC